MNKCPICKNEWTCKDFKLDKNLVITPNGSVFLSAVEHTIILNLLKHSMNKEDLISRIYTTRAGPPLSASRCLYVCFNRIRKKINPLGYTIVNVSYPNRSCALYALVKIE